MSHSQVTDRLERLERENRRMKRGAVAVGAVVLALVLIGAAQEEPESDVVEARTVLLLDESGVPRAQMDVNGLRFADASGRVRSQANADGFVYFDASGKLQATVTANGLSYLEQGNPRAQMNADGLLYADASGKMRAQVGASGFSYSDEAGRQRARFGAVEVVTPETGETAQAPGAAVFDVEGKVIWKAPG